MTPARALLTVGLLAAAASAALDVAQDEVHYTMLIQEKIERKVEQKIEQAAPKAAIQSRAESLGRSQQANKQESARKSDDVDFRKVVAEFIAMTLFVFFGCGSAMSIAEEEGSAWVLQVSLTFGLAITVLAYTVGHYSGAQINCAVTLGLVIYGHIGVLQGFLNFLGQMVGSVLGAILLKAMYPKGKDKTGGLATNSVAPGWSSFSAFVGEFWGTFLLMYVVFETAVNSMSVLNTALAPLAIGLSVFLAHSVLIPVDGCSINPTRTFGPALVESMSGGKGFKDSWVFWVGPLSGAAFATAVYAGMSAY